MTGPTGSELEASLESLHEKGPEFEGWLSNHGPMAVDALLRMGGEDVVPRWVAGYRGRLQELPVARWRISLDDWREPWGDPSRVGDWIGFFQERLEEADWASVLSTYWPHLVSGAVASAAHGLIRTGHAVRNLRESDNEVRRRELAHALGYWASRWQELPTRTRSAPTSSRGNGSSRSRSDPGSSGAAASVSSMQAVLRDASRWTTEPMVGGPRTRLGVLGGSAGWLSTADAWPQVEDEHVTASLDNLTDAALLHYLDQAEGNPVMLVHAVTAPRAARLVLPSLPVELHRSTWRWVGLTSTAIASFYPAEERAPERHAPRTADLASSAMEHGDEHVIKLVEVALESSERGCAEAHLAAGRALALIEPLHGWRP